MNSLSYHSEDLVILVIFSELKNPSLSLSVSPQQKAVNIEILINVAASFKSDFVHFILLMAHVLGNAVGQKYTPQTSNTEIFVGDI